MVVNLLTEKEKYDVIIVGGGAAGLSAAIYSCRKKLKTLVISVDIGGQNLLTDSIENYPGYTEMSGSKLMDTFFSQAQKFGANFVSGKAGSLKKIKGGGFEIGLTNGETYHARSVIIAAGKIARNLGIPGEEKFVGRGVSTCATCDAPFAKKRKVAVIGGGNSALEAAELLSKFADKIYIVHRRDEFRGDQITVDKIKKLKNVEMILNSSPASIQGDQKIKSVSVENVNTKEKRELEVDMIFVEIGYVVDTEWLKEIVKRNDKNEIIVGRNGETSQEGIFAAGDVTDFPYKQTVISAGSGATAALSAYNYLRGMEGKTAISIDWGKE